MWVTRIFDAPRELLRRNITLLVTSIIVASFAVIGPLANQVLAIDASWQGGSINYRNQIYAPEPPVTDPPTPLPGSDPRGMGGSIAYTWIETLDNGDQRAHTIFLDEGFVRSEEVEGLLIVYDYSPPNQYSNASSSTPITIALDPTAPANASFASGECNIAGIGWIVCPASRFLAEGVDIAYGLIREFLEVPAVTTDTRTGLYAVWSIVRSVANVCFILVLMAIIYSQLTSAGISNYGIKAILPRLIIGAILVNVSFWLTALAVDISNVLGYSIHAIFENVRTNLPQNIEVTWSTLTAFILFGGGTIGTIAFIGGVAGSVLGLGFMLISGLISVAFGIFVAFIILAARQAIITILIIIAPLAFIAFILPSTRNLFDRWRKSFTTLLMFFPLFALLFGGSSLAGAIIMNNADDRLHIVLIGLTVQFIPLVITPLLIQFSTGLLGRIAGLAKGRPGFVNNAKSWARDKAEYNKGKSLAGRGFGSKVNPFAMAARGLNRGNINRDRRRAGDKDAAETDARSGRQTDWRRLQRYEGTRRAWDKSDNYARESSLNKHGAENADESRWQQRIGTDAPLRQRYQAAHHSEFTASKYKETNESAAKLHSQSSLDTSNDEHFDRKLHATVLARTETDAATKKLEVDFDAVLDELRAGVNQYENAEPEVQARLGGIVGLGDISSRASRLRDLSIQTAAAGERKSSAEDVLKSAIAAEYQKDDMVIDGKTILEYAGGIGGKPASTLVNAKAFSKVASDQAEAIKAEKTLLSRTPSDDIFARMNDPDASAEQLAAYAGTIAGRGFHADHIKLLSKASKMYQTAVASGDAEEVGKMRDMIQQISSDQSKIAFGLRDYDRTLLGEGRYGERGENIYKTSRDRIMTNLSVETLANMDPDDINLLYEMHHKGFLSSDQNAKIIETWNAWQNDENYKVKIQNKHRNFLDRIVTGDYTSAVGGMPPPDANKYELTAADLA